jgi:hypothetical protein
MADHAAGDGAGTTTDPGASAAAPTPTPTPTPAPDAAALRAQLEAELSARFAAQLKELTGHDDFAAAKAAADKAAADKLAEQGKFQELAEQAQQQAAQFRQRYEAAAISAAIRGAAADSVDPETVHALLAGSATVGEDGAVSIGGKPAAEAVAALLALKPHLARAAGGQGSGAGGAGGGAGKVESMTFRELAELQQSNPAAYEAEIKRRAGGKA